MSETKKWAKCDCGVEMNPNNEGCLFPFVEDNKGRITQRIRYGLEDWGAGADDRPCHDCNVKIGAYHHIGCDWERCPVCKGQFISCDCDDITHFVKRGGNNAKNTN